MKKTIREFEAGYALLIGVDQNALPHLVLPDVAKDVAALESVLIHPARCGYPSENVKTISGERATRQGILDGLDWLRAGLQADGSGNTTGVIYFSGHGWRDATPTQSTYYLIPYDMQQGNYQLRALRADDFAAAINQLAPRRLLVILDCCHAAGMDVKDVESLANAPQTAAIPTRLFAQGEKSVISAGAKSLSSLAEGRGRAVLSSSQGAQKSYIRQDHRMSIFTYHLIEALTGHAQPQAGAAEVLVSDVMSYVTRTVPQSARQAYAAEQTPDFYVNGNFPVALLLGGKGLSKGEDPPKPLEMEEGTATKNTVISTGGGAYVAGNVSVQGGDFVGRDKIEGHVGNVGAGGQVAIGSNIQQTGGQTLTGLTPSERAEIERLLRETRKG